MPSRRQRGLLEPLAELGIRDTARADQQAPRTRNKFTGVPTWTLVTAA